MMSHGEQISFSKHNHLRPEGTLWVNDEETPQCVTILLQVDPVVLAYGMGEVWEEGDVKLAQASLCPGGAGQQ